jgi:uncharacterized protein YndB with AHSA1/START domain
MAADYGNVSDEAVRKATGKGWDEWIAVLDAHGADAMSHREIAAMLNDTGLIGDAGGWWAQSVTVGYEYAKGRRVKGETAGAGFQVGVQKTIAAPADELWRFISSADGMRVWLGDVESAFPLESGVTYSSRDGHSGEIRSVVPGTRLRLTFRTSETDDPTTLQLHVTDKGDRSALQFHHEKLRDAAHRATMKAHWQLVLKRIAAAF